MKYINLEEALYGGQKYVLAYKDSVRAVEHDKVTDTCYEKAELLKWSPERVIKALFFHTNLEMYGFVLPEFGRRFSPKKIFPRILGISRTQSEKFRNHLCPEGMEYGTCSPFILERSFSKDGFKGIFIHDSKYLEDTIVDISIGGIGEKAHRVSLHLPYSIIYKILYHQFGDKIKKMDLFE